MQTSEPKTKQTHAVFVTTRQGQIRFADRTARRWLRMFCGAATKRGLLPRNVCRWLEGMRGRPYGHALVLRRGQTLLFFRRLWPDSGESIPVVLEVLRAGKRKAARTHRGLTRRETQVHHWMGNGKANGEIALILGCSPGTVRKHVEHIRAKLMAENRITAARLAWEEEQAVQSSV